MVDIKDLTVAGWLLVLIVIGITGGLAIVLTNQFVAARIRTGKLLIVILGATACVVFVVGRLIFGLFGIPIIKQQQD